MKIFLIFLLCLLIVLFIASLMSLRMATGRIAKKKKSKASLARAFEADSLFGDIIKKEQDHLNSLPYEEWSIVSFDKLNLYAKFYKNNDSKKTINLFHGFRSSGVHDFSCAFRMYFEHGLNILIPDQRAHGKSEGSHIGYGVLERFDAKKWIEKVVEEIGDDSEVYLSGISMGASTVLMAAGLDLPQNLKAIVADCGFTSPKEIIGKVMREDMKIPKFPLLYTTSFLAKILAHYDFNYSTLDALKNTTLPIMFIHGRADDFVPFYMSEQNFDAYKGEKRAVWVDKAGHGTSFLYETNRCVKEIEDFLKI